MPDQDKAPFDKATDYVLNALSRYTLSAEARANLAVELAKAMAVKELADAVRSIGGGGGFKWTP